MTYLERLLLAYCIAREAGFHGLAGALATMIREELESICPT